MLRSYRAHLALLLSLVIGSAEAQSICQIQGSGAASPYNGQTVTTQGIVTALFTGFGSIGGYFIEQADCDSDPSTSNGIFVYDTSPFPAAVGLLVQVTGQVVEFNGVTEITNASATVLGSGNVEPTDITLPLASYSEWERYEGMLLRFPGVLTVTKNQSWVQYGELTLAPQRNMAPTNFIDPNDAVPSGTTSAGASNAAAVNAEYDLQGRNTILLDDGRTSSFPTPLPWVGPEGTVRPGSTITDLRGALHYSYGDYRLEPVGTMNISHAPRPAVPEVGGSIRAASLNVLNYWTTLGEWGAQNSGELGRQRTKLLAALQAMDADVFALHELENNDVAWVDLLDALNVLVGAGTYAGMEVDASGSGGTKSVIYYRTTTLTPVTELFSRNGSPFQRPHITQGFAVNADGGRFLFSTVHLRSKLCDNATGANMDQNDGQSCYNQNRRDQANALVQHWSELRASTGIQAQLIMGDFNAYTQEDPLDILRADGLERVLSDDSYSYYYQGSFGALDHAFATPLLSDAIADAVVWHINSDEPAQFNYADQNFSRYQPNVFRCSDHDPVLVGFSSAQLSVGIDEQEAPHGARCVIGDDGLMNLMITDPRLIGARLTVMDARGSVVLDRVDPVGDVLRIPMNGAPGLYLWRLSATDGALAAGRFVLTR